jgi:iron complex outermembrane receptor protein
VQRPFKAETLTSYELGLKSEWFERRVRLNGAVFYSTYDDLQVAQFVPSASGAQSIISNAGKANYKGVEVELTAMPVPGLRFNLSYGYLDAEYDKYEFFDPTGQFCGSAGATCDVADHAHFPTAPQHTAAVGAQYSVDAFDFGTLTARVDLTYNSGYQQGSIDSAADKWVEADAHTLLSARVSLADIPLFNDASAEVALWGRNLTDEEYVSYGIGSFDALGFAGGVFNQPRTYGVDFEVRF